jgi:CRISPR-associated protein Cas2
MKREQTFSKFEHMWIFAMFDLAVVSEENRREYTRFRKLLLAAGFMMLQFSVYARFCESRAHAATFARLIRGHMPPEGQVRLLSITDKQFGDMQVLYGIHGTAKPEEPPEQMLLF